MSLSGEQVNSYQGRTMRTRALVTVILLFSVFCTQVQLERSTLRQLGTLTDLRYKEVLDNLARSVHNPAVLPYFSGIGTGTTVVTDMGESDGVLAPAAMMSALDFKASRQVLENWTLSPAYEADRLEAMRCAYQRVVTGGCRGTNMACQEQMKKYLNEQELSELTSGWFAAGKRKDVPKGACYVGHYHDVYVWVMPGGLDGLSKFTLAILEIAYELPNEPKADKPVQIVERYEYDEKSGKLKLKEVTKTREEAPKTEVPAGRKSGSRSYKNLYNPIQSQIYSRP